LIVESGKWKVESGKCVVDSGGISGSLLTFDFSTFDFFVQLKLSQLL